jgi:hypothetical protein
MTGLHLLVRDAFVLWTGAMKMLPVRVLVIYQRDKQWLRQSFLQGLFQE